MSMRIAQKRSREEADAAAAAELATADTDDSDEEPIAPSVRQETPPDTKGVKANKLVMRAVLTLHGAAVYR